MKKIFIIAVLLLSIGCAGTLKTQYGDFEIVLTPDQVMAMYQMAISRDAGVIGSVKSENGKMIAVGDPEGNDTWGKFDGVFSPEETQWMKANCHDGCTFKNKQGDMVAVLPVNG